LASQYVAVSLAMPAPEWVLQRQLDAQTEIAGALEVLLRDDDDPGGVRERLQRATSVALRPWT